MDVKHPTFSVFCGVFGPKGNEQNGGQTQDIIRASCGSQNYRMEVTSAKEESFLSRMALNDNKAGMEGLDRDKINKIIMEASKVETYTTSEHTKVHK